MEVRAASTGEAFRCEDRCKTISLTAHTFDDERFLAALLRSCEHGGSVTASPLVGSSCKIIWGIRTDIERKSPP